MKQATKRTHDTPELTTAAFLKAKDFKLRGVVNDPVRPARKLFRFEDDCTVADAVMAFINGAEISAREFARSMSELKTLIYREGAM